MTTITTHSKNGIEYQIGNITSPDGKTFDITVYLQFPTQEQYDNEDYTVKIAGWHFGDYDPNTADQFIE